MAKLIRVGQTLEVPDRLPVVALRDLVFFPYMVLPLLIGRPKSLEALDEAERDHEGLLLLLAQKDAEVDDPGRGHLHRVGTIARVLQVTKLADGNVRVMLEGLGRAKVRRFLPCENGFRVSLEPYVAGERDEPGSSLPDLEALIRGVERLYHEYVHLSSRIPDELLESISVDGDRVRLAHLMSAQLLVVVPERQELLEATST